ncbi:DUF4424 family protein [Labrys monachus]|uniref:DUF4424 domain-containing protein n=1 Tax=Labrys monachus TaxID=217067 RepID=A0ABU0FLM9_9HYPH|nr:DUF4424 family protein [Labrys monachus]MDQ0395267.1 hypothetical protein [Labrys monachus]
MPISARLLLCSAALVLVLPPVGAAFAEEPVGNIDAGGLVIEGADQVELRSEDLYLSASQVRVSYRFFNPADHDLVVTIAFPMPDVTGEEGMAVNIPDPASPNFLGLRTKVDGQPVEPSLEQQAVFASGGGVQTPITDLLGQLAVPLLPVGEATKAALRRLGADDRRRLTDPGYAGAEGGEVSARWTLRSRFHWQQAFPAGKEVVVEQSYTPSVGFTPGIFFGKGSLTGESLAQYQKKYCTNPGFLKAADLLTKRVAAGLQGGTTAPPSQARQLYFGYAIARGQQIGRFRLVVDKAFPDNLVSFCGEGIKRIDGTRFELTRTRYTPDRNIDVLILDNHAGR